MLSALKLLPAEYSRAIDRASFPVPVALLQLAQETRLRPAGVKALEMSLQRWRTRLCLKLFGTGTQTRSLP